jgi:pilus assembly protein Flp/PilA
MRLSSREARRADQGATAVEYGLMVAFIALAIIATVGTLGSAVGGLFQQAAGWF